MVDIDSTVVQLCTSRLTTRVGRSSYSAVVQPYAVSPTQSPTVGHSSVCICRSDTTCTKGNCIKVFAVLHVPAYYYYTTALRLYLLVVVCSSTGHRLAEIAVRHQIAGVATTPL
eukprot:COSAG01_NODE_28162_length_667_cov_2.563380_1_plen_114_part_00